jgi:hypothetical protein
MEQSEEIQEYRKVPTHPFFAARKRCLVPQSSGCRFGEKNLEKWGAVATVVPVCFEVS